MPLILEISAPHVLSFSDADFSGNGLRRDLAPICAEAPVAFNTTAEMWNFRRKESIGSVSQRPPNPMAFVSHTERQSDPVHVNLSVSRWAYTSNCLLVMWYYYSVNLAAILETPWKPM